MRLSVRLTLAMVGLVAVTAASIQWLADRRLESVFLPGELARLDADARRAVATLDDDVWDAARSLMGFRRAVALEAMIRADEAGGRDPRTRLGGAELRELMARRFAAELALNPDYLHIGVVRGPGAGREILRVGRAAQGGSVRMLLEAELGSTDFHRYLSQAAGGPGESLYVSPVELERRDGRVAVPHLPVVSVATPLFTESGRRFGVLEIHLALSQLLAALPAADVAGAATYLVNADGDFLLHPDSTKAFGFELGRRHRIADEFPVLDGVPGSPGFAPRLVRDRHGREVGVALATARLGGGPQVALMRAVPRGQLLAPMQAVRRASVVAGAIAAAGGVLLALLLARRVTRPLERMTAAMRQFGTDHDLGLRHEGAGELRGLATAMEAMQAEIQRKTAELRESESRLRLALAASQTGVWEWIVATGEVYWSEESLRIIGGSPEPRLGSFLDTIHPEDAPRVRAAIDSALRNHGAFREEFRVRLPDGRTRWVANLGIAQYDAAGQPVRMTGTVQDVTDRREADEALRASEERFRELAESIDEAVWMTDPSRTTMLYVSPAYERIWGRPREDLFADPMAWLESIHAEDRLAVAESARERQAAGTYDATYRIVRPDGEVRWIHDRAYPVRDESGRVLRVVGVAADVTRQRELEAQFLQAQKMESVGRLAGGVAHDFNNILTVIQGHVALLRAGVRDDVDDSLEQVALATERATALTRQLLAFSRRQPLQPRIIDLADVVRNMTRFLERLLGEDIRLAIDLARQLPPVLADAGMIEQVVMNLAVNARDAMPEGGQLTLRATFERMSSAEARRHAGVPAGPLVCLTVADTGSGMDPETLQHAFEPFFTTKDVGKGTGLGLATVYGIVQQHRGWVGAESERGRGSTFRIWLPPASPVQAIHEAEAARGEAPGGTETILLVEDEASVRRLLTGILERQGYRIIGAQSGYDALRLWVQHAGEIQMLLTDMVMPDGMNGRDLLERLRAERPDLPALCMSGYTAEAVQRGAGLGADVPYLRKPFPPGELLAAVRRVLDART